MVKITFKIGMLIFVLFLSILAIKPTFQEGVIIKFIEQDSAIAEAGISTGEIIKSINNEQIRNMQDYARVISTIVVEPVNFTIKTSQGVYEYKSKTLDFELENLTIIHVSGEAKKSGLKENSTLLEINNRAIEDDYSFFVVKNELEPTIKLSIKTNKGSYRFLVNDTPNIVVKPVPFTRIKTGLDLQGGSRGLVKPEGRLTQQELNDLIAVSRYRLNVYGISDVNIRAANDLAGNKYMVVEVAGATPAELRDLIGKQGKFEAKIGNESVFIGGKRDIPSVCRNDETCARIEGCFETSGRWICRFSFAVYLSQEAAERHAAITDKLDVNITEQGVYLSKKLDLYLDDKLTDSLLISEGLKGKITTQISVQGSGVGNTLEEARKNAKESMQKLQTVLITGSLPFKLEIVKLDSISPLLGKEFIKNIFLAAISAIIAVLIIVFLRFRKIKITFLIMITMLSELIIILGVAALINWNLDLASIAGIIAAIGIGVDHQIIIADESRVSREYSWKERIKRAFFIIIGAYATTCAAMLSLLWAGAGLLRGFAVTTIIGITIGVLITRPAFADMISQTQD
jgi:preprotein translocase subunit SecD